MVAIIELAREVRAPGPMPGSVASRERAKQSELAGEWGEHVAADAHAVCELLVNAGEQHILAVAELYGAAGSFPYSDAVLARAALENLAVAVWMCEPALGLRARTARLMTFRLKNESELRKLGASDDRNVRDRIVTTAPTRGFTVRKGQGRDHPEFVVDGNTIGNHGLPGSTRLVSRLFLDTPPNQLGATLYKLWSATTHGTLHGLLRNLDRVEGMELPETGLGLAAIRASSDEANLVLAGLGHGYFAALDRLGSLNGWQSADLKKSVDNYHAATRRRVLNTPERVPLHPELPPSLS